MSYGQVDLDSNDDSRSSSSSGPSSSDSRSSDTKKGRSSKDRASSALEAAGLQLNRDSVEQLRSMKRGGVVRRGQRVKLHRGERAVRARKKKTGRM